MTQTDTNSGQLVSIVMPAYNAEKYLAEAVQSVLDQTYPHFELIIVDDNSKDSTAEIAKRFMAQDTRIKYIYARAGSCGFARNAGLKHCSGQFIGFLDADDIFYPDALETLMSGFQKNAGAMLCQGIEHVMSENGQGFEESGFLTRKANGEYEFGPDFMSPPSLLGLLLSKNTIYQCACLYRKEVFDALVDYTDQVVYSEDLFLLTRFHLHFPNAIQAIPKYVYKYRQVSNSTVHNPGKIKPVLESDLYVLDWLFSQTEYEVPEEVLGQKGTLYANRYLYNAIASQAKGHVRIADEIVCDALRSRQTDKWRCSRVLLSYLAQRLLPGSLQSILNSAKQCAKRLIA